MKIDGFNVDKHQSITALANELERWRINRLRKQLDVTALDKAIQVCDELLRIKGYARREHQAVTLETASNYDAGRRPPSWNRYNGEEMLLDADQALIDDYREGLMDDGEAYEAGLIDERGADLF